MQKPHNDCGKLSVTRGFGKPFVVDPKLEAKTRELLMSQIEVVKLKSENLELKRQNTNFRDRFRRLISLVPQINTPEVSGGIKKP